MVTDAFPLHRGESLEKTVQEHAVKLEGVSKDIGMLKDDTADLCADVDDIKKFTTQVATFIAVQTTLTGQLAWFVKIAAGLVVAAILGGLLALVIK